MINVVEALPIKAQVSLLLTLLFLWFVLFSYQWLRDFPVSLVVSAQNVISVCAVFIKSLIMLLAQDYF